MSGPAGRAGLAALLVATGFAAGLVAGLALQGGKAPAPLLRLDYEVRGGHRGLINPLLDCEVGHLPPGSELRPFEEKIRRLTDSFVDAGKAARISVYFRDLDNGPWFGVRESETFTPASLMKAVLIMAALAQAEEDPAFLAATMRYDGLPDDNAFGRPESPEPLVRGRRYTAEDLIRRTAVYSDNFAMISLGRMVRKESMRGVLSALGYPEELADRPDHTVALSPRTYGQIFRVLYNATVLSRPMSERALEYFAVSSFPDGLVAGVPPGTTVAHKYGLYLTTNRPGEGQLHDCGIVYHPGRPYFLCVMSSGSDVRLLTESIRDVSRAVYEEVDGQTRAAGRPSGQMPLGGQ